MDRRAMLTFIAATAGASGGASETRAAPAAARPGYAIARDGARLFTREWGDGPAILFVAAWAFHSQAWQYQMTRLCAAGFRCVAFDRRGHGRSDDPGRGYDMDTLADDIAAIVDHHRLKDFHLVGHSLGGAEAVRYLTRHPGDQVRRLVLIAPTTPCLMKTADNPSGLDPAVFDGMRNAFAKDFPGIVGANIKSFVEPGTSDRLVDWIIAMMAETSMQAVLECNRAFSTADFRAELPKLTLPTLVVQGDNDASAPLELTGRPTATLMKNARLVVYEGAPHGLIFTRVDRLHQDLLTFLRG